MTAEPTSGELGEIIAPETESLMTELRPPAECLAEVKEEHLAMLLSHHRPPELVKRVFSALMIMVSPFEPTHVDISWVAVQEWVKEVGTVKNFLDNLASFDVSMVPAANPERTAAFMRQSGLVRDKLVPLSDALANLADWLMGLCIQAGSSGSGGADGMGPDANGINVDAAESEAEATADFHDEATADAASPTKTVDLEGEQLSGVPSSPEKDSPKKEAE